jgi:hypothetical protein
MASITVNHSLWDSTEQFMNHDRLVLLWDAVESLLDDMATKSIHGQLKSVTLDGLSNLDYLLMSTMFKATLNQEVAEAINHQVVSLSNDGIDDIKLLLRRARLELVLQEDGSLLVIVLDDSIDDHVVVAAHAAIKQAAVVDVFTSMQMSVRRMLSEVRRD